MEKNENIHDNILDIFLGISVKEAIFKNGTKNGSKS